MTSWFQFVVDRRDTEVSGYVHCPHSLGSYHKRKSFPFGGEFFVWLNTLAYISRQSGALSITYCAPGKHTALNTSSKNQVFWPGLDLSKGIGAQYRLVYHLQTHLMNVSSIPSVVEEDLLSGNTKILILQWSLVNQFIHLNDIIASGEWSWTGEVFLNTVILKKKQPLTSLDKCFELQTRFNARRCELRLLMRCWLTLRKRIY